MTLHTPTRDVTRSSAVVSAGPDLSEEDSRFYDYDTCNVLLGKGGGGAVFLAKARSTGSLIAVKRCYVRGPFHSTSISPTVFSAHTTMTTRRLQPLPAMYSELQRSASSDDIGVEGDGHGSATNRLGPPRPLSAIPVTTSTATRHSIWGEVNSRHERDMQEESNHEVLVQRTNHESDDEASRNPLHRGALPWSHALVHENASTVPCPHTLCKSGRQLFWSPQRCATDYDHSCPPITMCDRNTNNALYSNVTDCAEEARILRALGPHPHIVAFLGSYTSSRKVTFVAMELMHSDVARELQRGNTALMREDVCAVVAFSILQALAHLHRHGIAHRDVKPGNIMLRCASVEEASRGIVVRTSQRSAIAQGRHYGSDALVERPVNVCEHNDKGKSHEKAGTRGEEHTGLVTQTEGLVRAALGDFSAAHVVHRRSGTGGLTSQAHGSYDHYISQSGVRGTLHYKAPEQLLGHTIADYTACDMWALGCTLVEMLTGSVAFSGERELQVQMQIFHRLGSQFDVFPAQVRPATLFDSVPASAPLVDLLRHLLALDPAQRPTAEEALLHPFFAPLRTQYEQTVQHRPCDEKERAAVAMYFPLALRYTRACELDVRRLSFRPIIVTPRKTKRVDVAPAAVATHDTPETEGESEHHVTYISTTTMEVPPQETNAASFLSEDGPSVHLSTLHSCLYATPQQLHGTEATHGAITRATVMLVDHQQQHDVQQGMSASPSLRWPTKECNDMSPTARRLSIASSRMTGRTTTRRLSSHASSERNTTTTSSSELAQQHDAESAAPLSAATLYAVSPSVPSSPHMSTQPPVYSSTTTVTTMTSIATERQQQEATERNSTNGVMPFVGARKMLCFESPLPSAPQGTSETAAAHEAPVITLTEGTSGGNGPQRWAHIPPCSLLSPALVRVAAHRRQQSNQNEEMHVDASYTQYSTGLPLLSCRSTPSCTPELRRTHNAMATVPARPIALVPPLPIPLALANARRRAAVGQEVEEETVNGSLHDSASSSSPIAKGAQKDSNRSTSNVQHDEEEDTRQSAVMLRTPQVQRSKGSANTATTLMQRRMSALAHTSRSRPRSEGRTACHVNSNWCFGEAMTAVGMWPRRPQRHCTPSVDSQQPQAQQQTSLDESVCYDNQDDVHAGYYAESATKRRRVEQSI